MRKQFYISAGTMLERKNPVEYWERSGLLTGLDKEDKENCAYNFELVVNLNPNMFLRPPLSSEASIVSKYYEASIVLVPIVRRVYKDVNRKLSREEALFITDLVLSKAKKLSSAFEEVFNEDYPLDCQAESAALLADLAAVAIKNRRDFTKIYENTKGKYISGSIKKLMK